MSEEQKLKNFKTAEKGIILLIVVGIVVMVAMGIWVLGTVNEAADRQKTIREVNEDVFCIQKGYEKSLHFSYYETTSQQQWVSCVDGEFLVFIKYTLPITITYVNGTGNG